MYGILPALATFELRLATNSYSSAGAAVHMSDYATVTDSWQRVTIPLADFGVSPGAMIAGIRFRGSSAVGRGEVLFDNIRFVESSVSPPPAPTVTSVDPTDGPTSGGTVVTITGGGLCEWRRRELRRASCDRCHGDARQ